MWRPACQTLPKALDILSATAGVVPGLLKALAILFRHILKNSTSTYEGPGSQFFRTTTGIQSGPAEENNQDFWWTLSQQCKQENKMAQTNSFHATGRFLYQTHKKHHTNFDALQWSNIWNQPYHVFVFFF